MDLCFLQDLKVEETLVGDSHFKLEQRQPGGHLAP